MGRNELPEELQQWIWDNSKTKFISQMANELNISKKTVKKYANPKHIS